MVESQRIVTAAVNRAAAPVQGSMMREERSRVVKYTDPSLDRVRPYKYDELTDMKRGIRLLRLLASGLENPILDCELLEAEFDSEYIPKKVIRFPDSTIKRTDEVIEYQALSWRWGTDDADYAVRIRSPDGEQFKMKAKKELALALKHLRRPYKDRIIWSDAICIDQENHLERNHQVQMMAMIYTRATKVCVWLGMDDDESNMAIAFIRGEIIPLKRFDDVCKDERNTENWQALQSLMQRPWFRRRWVVQEIALAQKASIYCGEEKISWEDFAAAVELFVEVESATHRLSEVVQKDARFYHVPGWFEYVSELGASLLVNATGKVFRVTETKGERGTKSKQRNKDEDRKKRPPEKKNHAANRLHREHGRPMSAPTMMLQNDQGKKVLEWEPPEIQIDPLARRPLLSLEYLVSALSTFEATEPRDVVYSLLAIARDTSPFADTDAYRVRQSKEMLIMGTMAGLLERKPYHVDYDMPYSDVCKDFISFCISRSQVLDPSRALDILCRPWAPVPTEESGNPSWDYVAKQKALAEMKRRQKGVFREMPPVNREEEVQQQDKTGSSQVSTGSTSDGCEDGSRTSGKPQSGGFPGAALHTWKDKGVPRGMVRIPLFPEAYYPKRYYYKRKKEAILTSDTDRNEKVECWVKAENAAKTMQDEAKKMRDEAERMRSEAEIMQSDAKKSKSEANGQLSGNAQKTHDEKLEEADKRLKEANTKLQKAIEEEGAWSKDQCSWTHFVRLREIKRGMTELPTIEPRNEKRELNPNYEEDARSTKDYWEAIRKKEAERGQTGAKKDEGIPDGSQAKIRRHFPGLWRGWPIPEEVGISDDEPNLVSQPKEKGRDAAAKDHQRDIDLPSWVATIDGAPFGVFQVPGMRTGRTGRKNADTLVGLPQGVYKNYTAAQTRKAATTLRFCKRPYLRHYSLFVDGFILDRVDEVATPAYGGNMPKTWPAMAGWNDTVNEFVPDAFVRTLVADRGKGNRNPPYYYAKACEESMTKGSIESGRVNIEALINNEKNSIITEFCRRVQEVIWNRCLIKTRFGRLGLVGEKVKVGDLVCIIYGCSVPVILRKRSKMDVHYPKDFEEEMNQVNDAKNEGSTAAPTPSYEHANKALEYVKNFDKSEITQLLKDKLQVIMDFSQTQLEQKPPRGGNRLEEILKVEEDEDRAEKLRSFILQLEKKLVQKARYQEMKDRCGWHEDVKELTKTINDHLQIKIEADRRTQKEREEQRTNRENDIKRLKKVQDARAKDRPAMAREKDAEKDAKAQDRDEKAKKKDAKAREKEEKAKEKEEKAKEKEEKAKEKEEKEKKLRDWEDFEDKYYFFNLMGESYIHGMMDGDAIKEKFEHVIKERTFELR